MTPALVMLLASNPSILTDNPMLMVLMGRKKKTAPPPVVVNVTQSNGPFASTPVAEGPPARWAAHAGAALEAEGHDPSAMDELWAAMDESEQAEARGMV